MTRSGTGNCTRVSNPKEGNMTLKEKVSELYRTLKPKCIAENKNLASAINSELMKYLDEHPEDRKAWFGHHMDC